MKWRNKMGRKTDKFVFSDEDINFIKSAYWIDCEYAHRIDISTCPVHGRAHRKLPDGETFAMLVQKFPTATMQLWANVYGVTREAVRLLYLSATGESMGERRLSNLYGEEPNEEMFERLFELYSTRIDLSLDTCKQIVEMSDSYFNYWTRRNSKNEITGPMGQRLEDAKALRLLNRQNPKERICNRCKVRKPIEDFYNEKSDISGKSKTCKLCSYAGVKAYNEKRQMNFDPTKVASEKHCPGCDRTLSRKHFDIQKSSTTGLQTYCKACQTAFDSRHPVRRAKMEELGYTENKNCANCLKSKEPIDFYLIARGFAGQKNSIISQDCRECVSEVGEQAFEEGLVESRKEVWHTYKKYGNIESTRKALGLLDV
jgi:hypothetical protein